MAEPAESWGFNVIDYILMFYQLIQFIIGLVLHNWFSLLGPNIFRRIFLSNINSFWIEDSFNTHFSQPVTSFSERCKIKQPLDRTRVFQEVEAPRFHDNRHMKLVRFPALRTGHLYPPGNTNFCYRLSQTQGHSAAGRIMST